ncbi:hypothetical protein [Clostridium botulinum]|uniref:hypothetical protein n=1 Tax=Clostridium botulinum TaxID=1491 RepID=UPI00035BA2C1|nr:hypothetical protein [Clostridium botulinum]AUN06641.1 hypothetical protein RSJ14_07945 [Clostridium botulinum]EPS56462.1 hypothetical protein CLQ_02051 [Clostridium botulinum Af84]MBN3351411.1 hypothetical protein [Clostridium botulinum]MBN3358689.1 hypothetical protein [Clostridium botulinum]MBN3365630.1 hypothetical protein [Clostridium botulinum]
MDYSIQINNILDNLAKKFNVPVEKLFEILHKQAKVELLNNCLELIVWLVICTSIYIIIKKEIKKAKEEEYYDMFTDEGAWGVCKIIYIILGSVIGFAGVIISTQNIIQIFLNPNYYIMEQILKMLNK